MSWLTLVLALFAIGTFLAISSPGQYGMPIIMEGGGVGYDSSGVSSGMTPPMPMGVPTRDASVSNNTSPEQGMKDSTYYPYPYPSPDVPVNDKREFLKLNYNASLLTRDVTTLTGRVETIVRGHEGRIDQESVSVKYGFVSFAVPQSKYEAFRSELESLVGKRFLSVNISSQNLLPQKLSIEEQQKQADTLLADYKATRVKLVNIHTSTVQTIQARIDAGTQELAVLRAQPVTNQTQMQIQIISDRLSSLKHQLISENSSYSSQLNSADANIKYAQDWQKGVQTQDKTLLDSVATVTGTISIRWISLWDMAQIYLPGYWIPTIFAVLALLSFANDRRRYLAA